MKYKILLPVIMLLISLTGFSQSKQYVYYFDIDLNSTDKAKSVINGIGVYDSGKFKLNLYNALDKHLISVEHFTDSSLQVQDGLFRSYYRNASPELEGNYLNGEQDGLWIRRDSAGRIIDSSIYNNGEKSIEGHTGYYKNGSLNSISINNIKTDQLEKTLYNDKGEIRSHVKFKGQNGILKRYDKGVLIGTDSVFTREEIEASFPGGEKAWTQYVFEHINRNINKLARDGTSGTCRLRFIIDKDGTVTGVEAITMQGTALARVAVNAIKKGPKWIPASTSFLK